MPSRFRVDAPFRPAGDQPEAIARLVEGVQSGLSQQVLLGVTGSGKTNVMAWAVEQLQRPVLVLSPILAETIARAGWTKGDVKRYLFDHARMPAWRVEAFTETWADFPIGSLKQQISVDPNGNNQLGLENFYQYTKTDTGSG